MLGRKAHHSLTFILQANATLHFTHIESDPDPLHTGEIQTIKKTGWSDANFPGTNLTSTFSQYWCFTDCKDKVSFFSCFLIALVFCCVTRGSLCVGSLCPPTSEGPQRAWLW